ncbi:MAG: DUF4124 domain-containing protein [Pseudomonadota bacterium]
MRKFLVAVSVAVVVSSGALADQGRKTYSWVDENGVRHYGDSVPAEYAEVPKDVLNEHAVTIDRVAGRKSEEEIAAERLEAERVAAKELQLRNDRALLATYLSVDEIVMHRDRRVELFQAQSKVTEMYLLTLERRLEKLMAEAGRYQPYSDNPDAPMIDPDLIDDIDLTKNTIERHEGNLEKFRQDEKGMIERFDGDIRRFEELKGLTASRG